MSERTKFLTLTLILLSSIVFVTLFNRRFDRYFLWAHASHKTLRLYWWNGVLFTFTLPFDTGPSLWVPVVPLASVVAYVVLMDRLLNLRVTVRGRRIHHYHVGLLSVAASVLLAFTVASGLVEYRVISFGWKGATTHEVLKGLGLVMAVGGFTLLLLDVRDAAAGFVGVVRRLLRSSRRN